MHTAPAGNGRWQEERRDRPEPPAPSRVELWRLRGATDTLRALSIETSFGYALALELDRELVLLHLQPSLEVLIDYSDRIHAALLQQGWQDLDAPPASGKERS